MTPSPPNPRPDPESVLPNLDRIMGRDPFDLAKFGQRLADGMREHKAHPNWPCEDWGCRDVKVLMADLAQARAELAKAPTLQQVADIVRGVESKDIEIASLRAELAALRAALEAAHVTLLKIEEIGSRPSLSTEERMSSVWQLTVAALSSVKDALAVLDQAPPVSLAGVAETSVFSCNWSMDHQDACDRCSGEFCDAHGTRPCACDAAQRHSTGRTHLDQAPRQTREP